ncbi:hypothetical protein EZ428_11535 [Pedobacter frigiditerrae]|uniref:Uncharacterized protein n=1 Tax=Pedobacter frigiditerrae TaxID=2530452 RepID=A0A4R0MYE4_9SPHI|nr:hypothetical protein EZ428_11535 [Pedobacter frigiditerrae]
MVLQSSFSTFHALGKELLTVSDSLTLVSVIIPQRAKSYLKKELSKLGINCYSVFGDLVNLPKKIKFDYDLIAKKNN